jgi:acyl CoA:acetate/3-ketoacid CoA transferase beta subunit
MTNPYNAMELMIACAARLLEDGSTVAVGTGVPCAAAMLAQRTSAPRLLVLFEAAARTCGEWWQSSGYQRLATLFAASILEGTALKGWAR